MSVVGHTNKIGSFQIAMFKGYLIYMDPNFSEIR